jgi:hypothetical protein
MVQHLAAAVGSDYNETRMFRNSPGTGALDPGAIPGAKTRPTTSAPVRMSKDEENRGMFAMNSFLLA